MQEPQTFGERAVGLGFNPSEDPRVDEIKRAFAKAIDLIDAIPGHHDGAVLDMRKQAVFRAQEAQMWAVKALTWHYVR